MRIKQHSIQFFKLMVTGLTLMGAHAALANATIGTVNVQLQYPSSQPKEPEYQGSRLFMKCQSMLPNEVKWQNVITTKSSLAKEEIWKRAWDHFGYEQQNEMDDLKGESFNNLIKFYTKFNAKLARLQKDIAQCETMRSLTKETDYTDSDSLKSGKSSVKQSVDGQVKCQSAGAETQDYRPCIKALNIYNGALVGTEVFTQIQTVKYQGDSTQAVANLDPNDPTSGLKAQKKDLEGKANITNQRAGLDVVKAGGLWATMQSIPTHSDLHSRCTSDAGRRTIGYEHIKKKSVELINRFYAIELSGGNPVNLKASGNNSMPSGPPELAKKVAKKREEALELASIKRNIKKYCEQSIAQTPELLMNTKARDGMKKAMIAAGIDGLKHKLTADQLKKQAAQVGEIIDGVEDFNPEDLPQFQGQDFQGSECDLNPTADGCDDFVQERSFGFQDSGPLQIHGMENASNFQRGDDPNSGSGDDGASSGSVDRSDAPKPIGIFDPTVDKKSGFEGRMPGAADVSRDGPAAASGGGGGGGVAGGGSPPPSQVQPQQKDEGPRMNDAGNSVANYEGGGGSLRRSGGAGAMASNRDNNDEDGNPFSELFGEEGPTSETLNFRDTASDSEGQINTPDTSIFEIISQRYANVQKQDRLLEYEVQDPEELQ